MQLYQIPCLYWSLSYTRFIMHLTSESETQCYLISTWNVCCVDTGYVYTAHWPPSTVCKFPKCSWICIVLVQIFATPESNTVLQTTKFFVFPFLFIKLNNKSSGNRMEIKWVQHVVRMVGMEKLVGNFWREDKFRVPELYERPFFRKISVRSMVSC
jgi:hypothetical protein